MGANLSDIAHYIKPASVWLDAIYVLLESAAVLATLMHPNHKPVYVDGDELTCRLPATPSSLGIAGSHVKLKNSSVIECH
ncbi:hypothetical protein DLR72_01255 [Vibrio paracholerae]|uniref:Uncharacterized protein n=1 Tax=Vibrio paracholerae TaxID=650003 RepID=A0ABD7FZP0_9VIBR|nr:hypothetical protein DLR72_01255 [Vibrio paracholerae]